MSSDKHAIYPVYPPRTVTCPSCGGEMSEEPGATAPCLCPNCGIRICEGTIEETNMIDFDAYVRATGKTAVYPDSGKGTLAELAYIGLGLAGESGELVDCIKKIYRDQGEDGQKVRELEAKLEKEAGDVMWYFARLCKYMGWNLEDILQGNLEKLNLRAEDGQLKHRNAGDSDA